MGVAPVRALDSSAITCLLQQHGQPYPFFDLVKAISDRFGLSDSEARDLIWRFVAEGLVRFSSDRSSILLPPEEPAQKVAG